MTVGMEDTVRNAWLDSITTRSGASALCRMYSGTQPAKNGTVTTLLVTLTFNATYAPAASSGVLTLNAITSGTAGATGTATWFREVKSDGTTFVMDGTVGTSGADINLNSTSIVSGGTVAISSWTFTAPNA